MDKIQCSFITALYHFVPVQKQGIQKNLSSISMVTARMPVLMDTCCMLDSLRDFKNLEKETAETQLELSSLILQKMSRRKSIGQGMIKVKNIQTLCVHDAFMC